MNLSIDQKVLYKGGKNYISTKTPVDNFYFLRVYSVCMLIIENNTFNIKKKTHQGYFH